MDLPAALRLSSATAYGASRPLPRFPARVPYLNRKRALSLGRGKVSSCPIPDPHHPRARSIELVESRPSHSLRFVQLMTPKLTLRGGARTGAASDSAKNRGILTH